MVDVTKVPDHVAKLILLFLHKKLSEEEHNQLDEWICVNDENLEVFEILSDIPEDWPIDPDQ